MQATVRFFDAATRSGTVLLDDGTELAYDAAAFDAGGLRLLRLGQRVTLRVVTDDTGSRDSGSDDTGSDDRVRTRVTALTLATLPLPGGEPPTPSRP